MYFPNLMILKEKYKIPNESIVELDTWLAAIKRNERKGFYSYFFADEYNLEANYAEELFLMATDPEIAVLKVNYEAHCPVCDEYVETISSIEVNENSDHTCDNEHDFRRLNNVYLSFDLIQIQKKK